MALSDLTVAKLWIVATTDEGFNDADPIFLTRKDALAAALKLAARNKKSSSVVTLKQAIDARIELAVLDITAND